MRSSIYTLARVAKVMSGTVSVSYRFSEQGVMTYTVTLRPDTIGTAITMSSDGRTVDIASRHLLRQVVPELCRHFQAVSAAIDDIQLCLRDDDAPPEQIR